MSDILAMGGQASPFSACALCISDHTTNRNTSHSRIRRLCQSRGLREGRSQ